MNPSVGDIEELKRRLLDKRDQLLRRWQSDTQAADELLGVREADWEDLAAEQRDARDLQRLSEAEVRALEAITTALERIELGTYGLCEDCEEPIDAGRLRAMPEAAMCAQCAHRHEEAYPRPSGQFE